MSVHLIAALLLLATLLSACGAGGGLASAPPSDPDALPSRTDSHPAASSTPAADAPRPLPSGGEGPVPVPAGTYVSETTGATITFELTDDAWQGLEDLPDVGFALLREFDSLTSLSVVAFDGEVFTDPCDPSATTTIDDSSASFVDWLASVPGVDAEAPTPATIGGQPALVLDLTTTLPAACTEPPWMYLWMLPTVGDFHFGDGETVRVWAVDAPGGTVALVAEANSAEDGDALLAAVDEILATMTIE